MRDILTAELHRLGHSVGHLARLAEDAGVCSQSLVYQFCSGRCDITTDKFEGLMRLLGRTVTPRSFRHRTVRK